MMHLGAKLEWLEEDIAKPVKEKVLMTYLTT